MRTNEGAPCLTCEARGSLTLYSRATGPSPVPVRDVQCPCCEGVGRVQDTADAHEACCIDDIECLAEAVDHGAAA